MSMRNSALTVETAIRSIIFQEFGDWEFIIIDDGSRDDCAALATALGDPRIRIVRHGTSRGLACRLNEAVSLARGEFIARMDADDISWPERLSVQVSILRANPTVDLLASAALVFRREGEVIGAFRGGYPHPTWCGRTTWFRNNRYDESMRKAEDQDLLMRTAASSRFMIIDEILLGYRKERIYFKKNFLGRVYYSRAVWRQARNSRDRRAAAEVIWHLFVQFAEDMLVIAFGGGEKLLRKKIPPLLDSTAITRWRAIWSCVSNDSH